ncbi:glycosyltransferase [Flavobacterium olei]|uniref:glycosyltransferase n=1 Tax=Flavobacterium olei TaxID=1886782 RepID=UPI00321A90E6
MSFIDIKRVVFFGFNNMFKHKRGVENVIEFQSKASLSEINYYIHWDNKTKIYHYDNLICISIKKDIFWILTLNIILYKIIKKEKKVLIHSHNALMSIFSVYQSNLYTLHDALYYLTKATNHKLNIFFFVLEKFLYFRVKHVHFISEYAKQMSLYGNRKNYTIIFNTSHLEKYNLDCLKTNSKRTNFQASSIKVFIVRSIEDRARIDLIIDVATKLINSDFEFFVAGKGPLLSYYQDKIESNQLENITLLGYVPDAELIDYYKECDIVIVPAEYGEGFGLPIIEGYLFNKPVIASNKCAIPEIICSNDFLFENSIESLIEKLNSVNVKSNYNFYDFYNKFYSNFIIIKKFNELYKTI